MNRLLLLVGVLVVLVAPAAAEARTFSIVGSSDAHVLPTADSPNLPGSVQIPFAILRPPTRQQELSFKELVRLWKLAGAEYDVPWQVLAAINKVETNFGRNMGPSTANAVGWMQFLPSTWLRWGVDGDGDGIADPWNATDAVYAAARYLAASGGGKKIRNPMVLHGSRKHREDREIPGIDG